MNEKKDALYLECYSGISGDMVTAALLDLGADEAVLRKALASLPLDGFSINISRVKKAGLDACDFNVVLDAEHENHDHDTAYLYGGVEECGHTHDVHEHNHDEHDHHHDEDGHEHRHGHCCHDHAAEHCHDHDHAHRGLAEVLDILNKADLTDRARATAVRIFTILGQAEAKAQQHKYRCNLQLPHAEYPVHPLASPASLWQRPALYPRQGKKIPAIRRGFLISDNRPRAAGRF